MLEEMHASMGSRGLGLITFMESLPLIEGSFTKRGYRIRRFSGSVISFRDVKFRKSSKWKCLVTNWIYKFCLLKRSLSWKWKF